MLLHVHCVTEICVPCQPALTNMWLFILLSFLCVCIQSEMNIVASFDRRGERIVTGSSKGVLLIFDIADDFTLLSTLKLAGNAIKNIEFARRDR